MTPVADPELEDITRLLVERFAPERVVLFGSRARGDHTPESDYDIIVVLDTALGRRERATLLREAIGRRDHRVDFIVYTPGEFARRRFDVGALAHDGEVEGRVLYARPSRTWPSLVREPQRDEPPESLAEWLARSRSDFLAMDGMARHVAEAHDAIVFHAHQGVEKLLKATLISRFVRPPRIHALSELLKLCVPDLRDDPRAARATASLDSLWPNMRYPDEPMPTGDDVQRAMDDARVIRDAVERICGLS